MTNLQINQKAKLKKITEIIKDLNLKNYELYLFGDFKAKLKLEKYSKKAKLILVTSINPTSIGEGKTTVCIGLHDAMISLGYKSILALREPSLGPVFGLKGGATGSGKSQVAPMAEINLNFTGDFHAITTANNLISSMIDNSIYWGNNLNIKKVLWKRCLDSNDRSLRNVRLQITKDFERIEQFQITAASELMAIFCLSKNMNDLKNRLNKCVIAINNENKPIFLDQLNVVGSLCAILKDAIIPNVIQTIENNMTIIHGGPFANIAHGCNSIIATKTALSLGDYVITECGFGADLGAEKFLNIKCNELKTSPNLVVIVATIKALKLHGGMEEENLKIEGIEFLKKGLPLLEKHIQNIQNFNLPFVVALNEFNTDSKKEKEFIKQWAVEKGIKFSFTNSWKYGSLGSQDLARLLLENIKEKTSLKRTYNLSDSIKTKIEKIATSIYNAKNVIYSEKALLFIDFLEKNNLDKQYICIAKTHSSLTDNPKILGVPSDWTLKVSDITISNGAGLIVVHCGSILTMPGLPRNPQATKITIDKNCNIKGLK